jgi:hypothetical protein
MRGNSLAGTELAAILVSSERMPARRRARRGNLSSGDLK